MLYLRFLLSVSLGFTRGRLCPHCISWCSLHSVQEMDRAGQKESFPFPNTVWYIFSSFGRCPAFLLPGGYASWMLMDLKSNPPSRRVQLPSQRSSAVCSPDQLRGTIQSRSLVSFWALITFMDCLATCWKMLVAVMPKALLSCAWRRWEWAWYTRVSKRSERAER